MNKRGSEWLLENVIFILLNLIFFSIMAYFIISNINSASVMQEEYAKSIALALDSAHPGMNFTIKMADAIKAAEKNLGKEHMDQMVTINGNRVTVKLIDKGGYTYSFFNNLNMSKPTSNYYLDEKNNDYVFFVGGYNEPKSN